MNRFKKGVVVVFMKYVYDRVRGGRFDFHPGKKMHCMQSGANFTETMDKRG